MGGQAEREKQTDSERDRDRGVYKAIDFIVYDDVSVNIQEDRDSHRKSNEVMAAEEKTETALETPKYA